MKIVIAGAGEVGTHLAKLLSKQKHDITIIDEDAEHLQRLERGNDLLTIIGSPSSVKVLSDAGVTDSDLFIAVTPHESLNITACLLATSIGARRKVARVDSSDFLEKKFGEFFKKQGIDAFIYPEKLAAEEIITSLEKTWVRQWLEFGDGDLVLIGMKVRDNATELVGKPLMSFPPESGFKIVAIRRDENTIIPRGQDTVEANDIVYFITSPKNVERVRNLAGKEQIHVRDIIIMGAGKITEQTLNILPDNVEVKVLESDKSLATKASNTYNCMVINSESSDPEMLEEENIEDQDAFLALSNSTENNILACLEAKRRGIIKTIAEVENMSYIPLAEKLDIGYIINKKLIAASYIYQYTLDVDVNRVKILTHADVEVVELTAKSSSPITNGPIKDLDLPRDMFIGGLVRNGKGIIAGGLTLIEPGDKVIVFCRQSSIRNLHKLFTSEL